MVTLQPPPFGDEIPPEYPEVQYYDVTLAKDAEHGLGITIAGYVGRDNTPGTGILYHRLLPLLPVCSVFNSFYTDDDTRSFCGQCRSRSDCTELAV